MKHTRRQLLAYIAEIQTQIGLALEYNDNDQAERAPRVRKALSRAHDLCITAQSTDRPASLSEQGAVRGFRIYTEGAPTPPCGSASGDLCVHGNIARSCRGNR